jgi:hypothetical protein
VQHALHREGEDLADERQRLHLWVTMLKETTVSERAVAWARHRGFDLQMEDLTVRARDVEELEGQLLEWEGLDDIILRRELEVLSTSESTLERREADLDRQWKALEDARAQILASELDADSREVGLRDQEARLAARELQLVER